MRRGLVMLLILSATACSPCRRLAPSSRDSVRIEVRTRTEQVRDTVYVEIPAQWERVTVRDTASRLENDYARSDARINSDGTLFHSLATKPQRRPAPFDKPIEYRDSIIYRDRVETVTIEVPRDFTWWQKFRLWGFWVLLAGVAVMCRKKIRAAVRWLF